jgi:hypothetical protein
MASTLDSRAPPKNSASAFQEEGLSRPQPPLYLNLHILECSTGFSTFVRPRRKMVDETMPGSWLPVDRQKDKTLVG